MAEGNLEGHHLAGHQPSRAADHPSQQPHGSPGGSKFSCQHAEDAGSLGARLLTGKKGQASEGSLGAAGLFPTPPQTRAQGPTLKTWSWHPTRHRTECRRGSSRSAHRARVGHLVTVRRGALRPPVPAHQRGAVVIPPSCLALTSYQCSLQGLRQPRGGRWGLTETAPGLLAGLAQPSPQESGGNASCSG